MRDSARGPRLTAADIENRNLRVELAGALDALAESDALIAELHVQLDRANAAAARMAQRAVRTASTFRRAA